MTEKDLYEFGVVVDQNGEAARKVGDLAFQLSDLRKQLGEAKKSGDADNFGKIQGQVDAVSKELSGARKELNQFYQEAKASKLPADSIAAMRVQYAKLRSEIDKMSTTDPKFKQRAEEAKAVKVRLDEATASMNDFRTQVGGYRKSIEEALAGLSRAGGIGGQAAGLLGNVLPGGGAGGGGGLVSGLNAGGAIGLGIGAVVSAGAAITKEVDRVNKELIAAQGTINRFVGVSGEALDQLSVKVLAVADTFDVSVEQQSKALAVLLDQYRDLDADTGQGLIQKALLGAGDPADLLDRIRTELRQLTDLKIPADSALALLTEASNRNINIDVLAEPIIRLRELTPSTLDALNAAFGKQGAQKVLKQFADDPFSGIIAISNRLNELGPTSREAGLLLADVFAGAGEDAVVTARSLADLKTNLDDLIDPTNELTQVQLRNLAANERLRAAQVEVKQATAELSIQTTGFFTNLKAFGFEVLDGAIRKFQFFSIQIKAFAAAGQATIRQFVDNVKGTFEGIGDILSGNFQEGIQKLAGNIPTGNLASTFKETYQEAYVSGVEQLVRTQEIAEANIKAGNQFGRQVGKGVEGTLVDSLKKATEKALEGSRDALREQIAKLEKEIGAAAGGPETVVEKIQEVARLKNDLKEVEQYVKSISERATATAGADSVVEEITKLTRGLPSEVRSIKDTAEAKRQAEIKSVQDSVSVQQRIRALFRKQEEDKEKEHTARLNEIKSGLIDFASNTASQLFGLERARVDRQVDAEKAGIESIYQARINAAEGNAAEQERLQRQLTEDLLKADRRAAKERKRIAITEAIIQGGLAVIKSLDNPIKAILAAAAVGVQIAIMKQQQFAHGGEVKRLPDGVIKRAPNFPTQPGGDNIQVLAQADEVFLSKKSRAKAERIFGPGIWSLLGVPGVNTTGRFVLGGIVPGYVSPSQGAAATTRIDQGDMMALAQMVAESTASAVIAGLKKQAELHNLLQNTRV